MCCASFNVRGLFWRVLGNIFCLPSFERELITVASRAQTRIWLSRDDVIGYRLRVPISIAFFESHGTRRLFNLPSDTPHTYTHTHTHTYTSHTHTHVHVIARASVPRCLRCLMSGRRKWGTLYRVRVLTLSGSHCRDSRKPQPRAEIRPLSNNANASERTPVANRKDRCTDISEWPAGWAILLDTIDPFAKTSWISH